MYPHRHPQRTKQQQHPTPPQEPQEDCSSHARPKRSAQHAHAPKLELVAEADRTHAQPGWRGSRSHGSNRRSLAEDRAAATAATVPADAAAAAVSAAPTVLATAALDFTQQTELAGRCDTCEHLPCAPRQGGGALSYHGWGPGGQACRGGGAGKGARRCG
eukprot:scaffold35131_cov90-Isochrysis_galbana.AAC.1